MIAPLDLDRLCIHQATLMPCDFGQCVESLARNGVRMTAVWGDKLDEIGTANGAQLLRDAGVASPSLCFGILLPDDDENWREINLRRIDQAAQIGATSLIMLTGGLTGEIADLRDARTLATERLADLIEPAHAANITLALEPLHPMVCGFRSVISSVQDALDMIDAIDAPNLGIALDAYGLWWDHGLEAQIDQAGSRIINFHTSDWLRDTSNIRVDRGMPGDGLINNRRIRSWVEKTGFTGPVEIEIFSKNNWWQRDPDEVIQTIIARLPQL